jgi:hypothetical protein
LSPAAPRDPSSDSDLADVARELRGGLTPLLHALAGDPPRPVRLTQGIRLDKSLASRLVQAIRADDDIGFLHQVPSPTGLRILLERARGHTDASLLRDVEAGVRRFETLLDRLPGGRQALDARMGASSSAIREKREQTARQASFKAVSFLFGHFCETLTTALFLLPSATPGRVDAIEVHRRLGLQRLTPGMALPLLSIGVGVPDDAGAATPRMLPLVGDAPSVAPTDYLLAGASSPTLPELEVVREGSTTTFALAPGEDVRLPTRLTTALRVLRAEPLEPDAAYLVLRNYMLHTPCRTLIRDLYIAPGLWPDARPQIDFYLPGPSGTPLVSVEPGAPHLRRLNLTARIEQLPAGRQAFDAEEVSDQGPAIALALERAGLDTEGWRGWRCRMAYPVPLVEMQLALRFAGR